MQKDIKTNLDGAIENAKELERSSEEEQMDAKTNINGALENAKESQESSKEEQLDAKTNSKSMESAKARPSSLKSISLN